MYYVHTSVPLPLCGVCRLPPEVQRRVNALKNLQVEFLKVLVLMI